MIRDDWCGLLRNVTDTPVGGGWAATFGDVATRSVVWKCFCFPFCISARLSLSFRLIIMSRRRNSGYNGTIGIC